MSLHGRGFRVQGLGFRVQGLGLSVLVRLVVQGTTASVENPTGPLGAPAPERALLRSFRV